MVIEWNTLGLRKAYAVAIMAHMWMGGALPQEFVDHANRIQKDMMDNGTWLSA